MNKAQVLQKLKEIEVIKQGDFVLKSGQRSAIYIDLRHLIAYPQILSAVSQLLGQQVKDIGWDLICGVPYNAIPLATCMSLNENKPMVLRRKEVKHYGTKKQIEGKFSLHQTCLVVEDVTTTGGSIVETIQDLEKEGLVVKDVVVLVERDKAAREFLAQKGYQLHSVYTLEELLK